MKSKDQKREEAYKRMVSASYENSRAKRKGTLTQEEWEERQSEKLATGVPS